jgi:hypothetical protein
VNMARQAPALPGCLALLLALVPVTLAAPRVGIAASAGRTFAAAARSVDAGGRLTVTGYRLEGQTTDSTLELQRLEVWDPTAQIVVQPGGGARPVVQGPPDTRYFKGSLAGAPGSAVVLSVDASGGVSGIATNGKDRWALSRPALSPVAAAAGVAPAGLSSRKATRAGSGTASRRPFHCGASDLEPQQAQRAQQASSQDGAASRKLLAGSALTASVALETDGELFQLLGGTVVAVTSYVGQLVAYADTIFAREIGVDLRITWLGVYPIAATDPWPTLKPVSTTRVNSTEGLYFLRDYWNNPVNRRTGIQRTFVHMLSGQFTDGGIAYVGVLCQSHEFGSAAPSRVLDYAFSGAMVGDFEWSGNAADYPTQPVWDPECFLHETGHLFGARHTHDYCIVTPDDPTTVDDCAQSRRCLQNQIGVLPTCTPGYAGGSGTIMSCDPFWGLWLTCLPAAPNLFEHAGMPIHSAMPVPLC